jgi:hypothetical protein
MEGCIGQPLKRLAGSFAGTANPIQSAAQQLAVMGSGLFPYKGVPAMRKHAQATAKSSQNRTLNIEITRDRQAKPLAIVKNFPGLDAEMYSDSLRKMAAQLIQAADDLDAVNSEQAQAISLDDLIAKQEQERGIDPLPLEPELLLDRIVQGGHSGQFLADAFLSTYRTDKPFLHSLGELARLDADGFRLFHEILHMRHVPGWSDDGLYQIELQIKAIAKFSRMEAAQ